LSQEGLLRYTAKSGFVVRGFSVKEITDGVAVRGGLEAMACRTVAELGMPPDVKARLRENIAQTEALSRVARFTVEDVRRWCDLNGEFHETIVQTAGNETLAKFVQQTDLIPLAGARTIAATFENLDKLNEVVIGSLGMHRLVFDALEQRQPDRAEMLMLEHVYQGRQGLRRFLEAKVATSSQADIGVVQLLAQHDASATGLDRIPTPSTSTSTTSPGTRKRGGARL
jgi:GntR family transcriptional regulator of vanillate catabolism